MAADDVIAAKKATRSEVLGARDALTRRERDVKSAAITSQLVALPPFTGLSSPSAGTVAAYLSFGTEFDTSGFVGAVMANGMRLVLPRVNREHKRIDFFSVTDLDTSLVAGTWGIREPDPARCAHADAREIDFMLVPGVAFTRCCERLGYGGGFYDAAISTLRTGVTKAVAAFDLQIVDELALEPHDRKVDLVVTESAVYERED